MHLEAALAAATAVMEIISGMSRSPNPWGGEGGGLQMDQGFGRGGVPMVNEEGTGGGGATSSSP